MSRHNWTIPERHFLFICFNEYRLSSPDTTRLFLHQHGTPTWQPSVRLVQDQYGQRDNPTRGRTWRTEVIGPRWNARQRADRAAARRRIRNAARALGIRVPGLVAAQGGGNAATAAGVQGGNAAAAAPTMTAPAPTAAGGTVQGAAAPSSTGNTITANAQPTVPPAVQAQAPPAPAAQSSITTGQGLAAAVLPPVTADQATAPIAGPSTNVAPAENAPASAPAPIVPSRTTATANGTVYTLPAHLDNAFLTQLTQDAPNAYGGQTRAAIGSRGGHLLNRLDGLAGLAGYRQQNDAPLTEEQIARNQQTLGAPPRRPDREDEQQLESEGRVLRGRTLAPVPRCGGCRRRGCPACRIRGG